MKVNEIKLKERELQYTLKRSSRKTIGITIDKTGLTVTCPFYTSERSINQLLINKSDWILKKLLYVESRIDKQHISKQFKDGEAFYFLGKAYLLKFVEDKSLIKPIVRLEPGNLIVYFSKFDKQKIKNSIKLWYVDQFKLLIEHRIPQYAQIIGVYPKRIAVREQKTRWGSCSAKGNINLNWKLIMAPVEVLDYVLVHELCHLRELNHSKKYWQLVENIVPQYKSHRKWLKENGDKLSIE